MFVLGLRFSDLSNTEYLSSLTTYKYLFKNSILIFGVDYELPGVFSNVPFESAVNGSLWTLPHELRLYILLCIILSLSIKLQVKFQFFSTKILVLLLALFACFIHLTDTSSLIIHSEFSRLFYLFFAGASFYMWRDTIKLSSIYFIIVCLLLLVSLMNKTLFFYSYYVCLPFLVLYIAYIPKGFILKFNNWGDYSYGMYIYAFPIQQSLIALDDSLTVIEMIIYSFGITFVLAYISWHLIEKKFLELKPFHTTLTKYVKNIFKYDN